MSKLQHKSRSNEGGIASEQDSDSLDHFKKRFPQRFLVRFHMTLLLLGVCASGMLASKVLFEVGLRSMLVRYLIAVCISYLVFFILMRVWLWYVGATPKDDSPASALDPCDAIDVGQVSLDVARTGATNLSDGVFSGTGGDFGGGGATDMWGGPSAASQSVHSSVVTTSSGGSSSKSGGWDFDLGDEAIVLIALGILLLVIFGAGAYLVYAAPEILAEAAFEALLAAGLIKASRKITRRGWIGSVLRATWVPFVIVLLMTGIFGWVAQTQYPDAARLSDILGNRSSKSVK